MDIVDEENATPLLSAVVGNHTDIVTWLIEHGANVDHQEKYGDSPLSIVVDENYTTIARLLVEKGADVHKHVLLHNATYRGKIQELSLLLELGVDLLGEIGFTPLNAQSLRGYPYTWCLQWLVTLEVARLLIDNGGDPDAKPSKVLLHYS